MARSGFVVFLIGGSIGLTIGVAEYVASGAYSAWTWIKVGILYLLSFCGVTLRAVAEPGAPAATATANLRLPLLAGTVVLVALLVHAGGRARGVGQLAALATAFAVPTFLVSLVAELTFPGYGTLSPVLWQAAAFPAAIGIAAVSAGRLMEVVPVRTAGSRMWARIQTALAGAWRMCSIAILMSTLGWLALAAAKPDHTVGYVRWLTRGGSSGAVLAGHHLLLLPNQALFVLDVAGGGEVRLTAAGDEAATIDLTGIHLSSDAVSVLARSTTEVPLGGGFYVFLLVPALATVLGGRRAGTGWSSTGGRILHGIGAGLVYAAAVVGLSVFAAIWIVVPIPGLGFVPLRLEPTLVPTAVAAVAWGVLGGAIGAATTPFVRR